MVTLSKAQFKEQLKDPEVAHIKRSIHLLRKTLREYDWVVTSHHDKRCKCFELKITPRSYDFKYYDIHWVQQYFNDAYDATVDAFRGRTYTTVANDMCDTIKISLPYNRPEA